MFDTHIHTDFSTDSSMTIEEAMKVSKEKGIGLIITEHMDMNCPEPGKFVFDLQEYFTKFNKYRSEKLLLGIELGLTQQFTEKNFQIAKGNPFDYVLGSIHFLGSNDLYYPETYVGRNKKTVYKEYLKTMHDNIISSNYIDSLAHIDYICRYAPYEDKEISYSEYPELIDDILKALIQYDISLEVNTRRLGDIDIKSLLEIYSRYKELGGKYVTIGSDSHSPNSIGTNFKEAMSICEKVALKPVYFKNREMEYISL